MLRSLTLSLVVSTAALAGPTKVAPVPKKPLTFGVSHPYGEEHALKAKAALEPYLTKTLGSQVTVQVFATYEELSDALATNKVDLAWITPVAFVQAAQKHRDVTALSKAMRSSDGGLVYRAVFITKASSPVTELKLLKGKKVAWVSKLSASGYLFPRALMKEQGLEPDTFFSSETFAGDHPAVCKAVRDGQADVGVTYAAAPKEGAALEATGCADSGPVGDFKVVASTQNVPNEVIASSPEFPPTRVDDVLATFGRMSQSTDGKKVLADVFRAQGFGVAVEGDFDTVVELLKAKDVKAKVPPPASKKPKKK